MGGGGDGVSLGRGRYASRKREADRARGVMLGVARLVAVFIAGGVAVVMGVMMRVGVPVMMGVGGRRGGMIVVVPRGGELTGAEAHHRRDRGPKHKMSPERRHVKREYTGGFPGVRRRRQPSLIFQAPQSSSELMPSGWAGGVKQPIILWHAERTPGADIQ